MVTCEEHQRKEKNDYYRLENYFKIMDQAKNIKELDENIKNYHIRHGRKEKKLF